MSKPNNTQITLIKAKYQEAVAAHALYCRLDGYGESVDYLSGRVSGILTAAYILGLTAYDLEPLRRAGLEMAGRWNQE